MALQIAALYAHMAGSIRARRLALNISYSGAAEEIGIAQSTLHRAEMGKGCTTETFIKIIDWLERDID